MEPVDLADLRSVPDLQDFIGRANERLRELNLRYEGQPFPDDVRAEFGGLTEQSAEASKRLRELEARHAMIARLARDPRHVEAEPAARGAQPWRSARSLGPARMPASWHSQRVVQDHDDALRALEGIGDRLDAERGERLERLIREKDSSGHESRYIAAHGDPDYATAYAKMLMDPQQGHLTFTPQESEAVWRARQVIQERAMGDVTGSAGGFGIPIAIDPSIALVSAGVINPLRDLARVDTINTFTWRGIDSDGVTAAFTAEATEVSDASPSLRQPQVTVQRANAFIPFSVEVGQDYPGLLDELGRLIADAKNVLEATKFLLGSGSAEPVGLLTIGTTGALVQANARVLTATTATLAYADWWTFKQAIPVRFLPDATMLWHPVTGDTAYQLSPAGSTTLALLMPEGRNGPIAGVPTAQLSTVATGATTGTRIAVAGNFKVGFRIIDRVGLQTELVPVLLGATNRFPTGQRGVFAWWRTGCTAIGSGSTAGALKYLEIK